MRQAESSVQLNNVSVWFDANRERRVLDNVSLDIAEGEFVALVGKSGCGKTTILNLLAGIFQPNEGSVRVHGRPVDDPQTHLGYMFARDCLFPWRKVIDNVELPLEINRVEKAARTKRAAIELERVGLAKYLQYYPGGLSHGMRQRVALARTWVLDPDVLLMDEPFAALDAQTRLGLERDFLNQWNERKSTVIFVTHDLTEAIALADRIVVLADGQITLDEPMPFGWPRDPEGVIVDPRFGEIFKRVRAALSVASPDGTDPREVAAAV
ncbi:ATP-binding cassette domain-containing protein [Pusillimonas sp. TS35]|uniref:ABC transporter ATP-binding protein n=1 Tax=Paracandidimonas lactea TaxID=2895524 RepID=UPI00136F82EB|nr:ABC transporter ATP-binding protein [Paracandidimonas lactea]MYN12368.1 ATP-binding cassette domain-containing protein [Pusillimonas sp. TS35]